MSAILDELKTVATSPHFSRNALPRLLQAIGECGKHGVLGQCKDHPEEHPRYMKELICMRQQCPECGKDGSKAHERRISRWIDKARQLSVVGYWVVELPGALRNSPEWATSPAGLRRWRKQVLSVLAGRHGRKGLTGGFSPRGLWSYHFFGDYYGMIDGHMMNVDGLAGAKYHADFLRLLEALNRLGCRDIVIAPNQPHDPKREHGPKGFVYWRAAGEHVGTQGKLVGEFLKKHRLWVRDYSSIEWNPHLNILTDSGYVEPDKLEGLKSDIRKACGIPDLIIHYEYRHGPAKMMHTLRYVLRSTFLDYDWSPELANGLAGFVNMGKWGTWANLKANPEAAKWEVPTTADSDPETAEVVGSLEKDRPECPVCGAAMQWAGPVSMKFRDIWHAEAVGNSGYYVLPAMGAWHGHAGLSPAQVARSACTKESSSLTPEQAIRLFFLRRCAGGREILPDFDEREWRHRNGNAGSAYFTEDELHEQFEVEQQYEADERNRRSKHRNPIENSDLWDQALADAREEQRDA